MPDDVDPKFSVGYRNPPRHSQFKPGQSGNPAGRPKKKGTTFAESIEKELNTSIIITEGDKKLRVTKLRAIAKRQTNMALGGDARATEFVRKAVEAQQSKPLDSLFPLLQEMRAINANHEAVDRGAPQREDAFNLTAAGAAKHVTDDKD